MREGRGGVCGPVTGRLNRFSPIHEEKAASDYKSTEKQKKEKEKKNRKKSFRFVT